MLHEPRHFSFRNQARTAAVLLCLACLPNSHAGDAVRFQPIGQLTSGRADWVTVDERQIAFGSGRHLFLGKADRGVTLGSEHLLGGLVSDGVLIGGRLFVVEDGELRVLDLHSTEMTSIPVQLDPPARRPIRLARMTDYVVVAEDGFGLRWIAPPSHDHQSMKGGHHLASRTPKQIGSLRLEASFSALAASDPSVYALTTDGRLAIVDLSATVEAPEVRYLQLDADVHALAATGTTLYGLGSGGLQILDLSSSEMAIELGAFPSVAGRALQLAGRTIYIADGARGVVTVDDRSPESVLHVVNIGDTFFNPAFLNIAPGDSVRWINGGTIAPHNVRSCTPLESGCGGQTANESFFSGAPTTSFVFGHPFATPGSNPYVCQVHTIFMTGQVSVTAPVAAPPGVPDGTAAGTPLIVDKLVPDGTDLSVAYDNSTCSPDDHQIIFGTAAQLPAVSGGVYGVGGSVCAIGIASPFVWSGSPAAAPGSFVWFLALAENGIDEGSWGKDSAGLERDGSGTGGSSGQCGVGSKDLSNACGQ